MSRLKPAVNKGDHITGNETADITLVEFGDFECPHCGHAHPLIQRLLKEKGDQFKFVYRHFPLQESHPHAYIAALAAEAAGRQDRFWEMHDLIFEHQTQLNTRFFLELAERLNLDLNRFGDDWKSEEGAGKVELDFESGVRSGVNGTPTFFVNGVPVYDYDEHFESLLRMISMPSP
jgi:protein-disulfide isomerase